MNITVVGSTDRRLIEALKSGGFTVVAVDVHELATIAGAARQPDVVVLDQRGRGALPPALTALKRQHPSTPILMVLAELETQVMLEAMRAGVGECVAEPLNASELQAAVNRVIQQRPGGVVGETFAVVGVKGGVGATTVAVNLACALSSIAKESTLLVDLHVAYGDVGLLLGVDGKFGVGDALDNIHRLDAVYLSGLVTPSVHGIHVLPSSERVMTSPLEVRHVRTLLETASRANRYVVLDVPRSDSAILDGLEMVTAFVLVANQELSTLRNAARIAKMLRQRYGNERVRLVLNRFDPDNAIGVSDVEQVTGGSVGFKLPSNYPAALASLNKGRPLVVDGDSTLATALTDLSRSLTGTRTSQPGAVRQKAPGFLSRLTGRR